jgi:hypothetical protein
LIPHTPLIGRYSEAGLMRPAETMRGSGYRLASDLLGLMSRRSFLASSAYEVEVELIPLDLD